MIHNKDGHSPDCTGGGKGYVRVGACSCGAALHECRSCSRVASKGQSWGFGLCQCGDFRAQPDDPKQHDQPTLGKREALNERFKDRPRGDDGGELQPRTNENDCE